MVNLTNSKGREVQVFLSVNTLLGLSHGLLLACCPGGLEALRNDSVAFSGLDISTRFDGGFRAFQMSSQKTQCLDPFALAMCRLTLSSVAI